MPGLGRLALAVLLGSLIGWQTQGWRMDAQHQRAIAEQLAAAEAQRLQLEQQLRVAEQAALDKVATVEQENAQLDRCIRDGRGCGLRVKVAACPGVPAAPGVGAETGGGAELDPDARQDYYALRAGIVRLEQALKVCTHVAVQP